jgi:formylglycine-generating enzyme required for sulfatase activity
MSSLADLPDLVGFFSYSNSDDAHSDGALSLLRQGIRKELRLQLGSDLRLWQDVDAIPLGAQWDGEIRKAIAESAFFIPIVSPAMLNSDYCGMEFDAFLDREAALGRGDLVFPILYIPVSGLTKTDQPGREGVLKIVQARQYADWTGIRQKAVTSEEVKTAVERFCRGVVEALHRNWESPDERRRREEIETQRLKEEEVRRLAEAEALRLAEEQRRRSAEAEALRRQAKPQKEMEPQGGATERPRGEGKGWFVAPKRLIPLSLTALIIILVPAIGLVSAIGWFGSRLWAPPVREMTAVTTDQPAYGLDKPLSLERERALKAKDSFRECDDCPEMVVVPVGSFTMGSPDGEKDRSKDEGPQHVVTISRSFAVGKVHVSIDQFAAFVKDSGYQAGTTCYKWASTRTSDGSWRDPGFAQEGSHPVVCVSWDDANAYAKWLAKKTGKPYRLLSEAEWEYAARGRTSPGTYPRFWFGNDEKDLCRNGNGADQKARDSIEAAKNWTIAPCNDGYAYTSPAGHYELNAFGLYDMAGNAWQWTADCYHDSYGGAPADGSAWTTGTCALRVLRGGSWNNDPQILRSADRVRNRPVFRSNFVGFRVARTLTP